MQPMERRCSIQRGSVKGPVLRNSGRDTDVTYLLILHILIMFLGGGALIMLAYSWFSPYWYMMGRRAYTVTPELRVLGLTELLEGSEGIEVSWLWKRRTLRTRYKLTARRNRICNEELDADNHSLESPDGTCDLDCVDMKMLGSLRVLCDSEGLQIEPRPIPIVPAPRIMAGFDNGVQSQMGSNVDLTLRWGCERRPSEARTFIKCPVGYKRCPKNVEHQCRNGTGKWSEPACCVDREVIGSTLFNVTKAPTYVHVFGWAQWQATELRDQSMVRSEGQSWCSVRHFRCKTLTQLTANGRHCLHCITFAGLLMFAALAVKVSRFKRKAISGVALLFAAAAAIIFYASWTYYTSTARTLRLSMTPIDKWMRPYVHSMNGYDYNGRTIMSMPKDSAAAAEWMYYHINARVDYVTEDPDNPKGFTLLWGATFCLASGIVSAAACLVCLEMQCVLLGFHPLFELFQLVLAVVLFVPSMIKQFVDDNLAAYPVLHVYPWQKLYPKAFTAGSWLPFPYDEMYDYGLMLPVHCIRAIWDYVSCQDIASPQEKEVLNRKGIYNDRLVSLLCSRRSYFVMMACLGALNFIANLTEVVNISDQLAHLRQAESRSDSYPKYRCDYAQGECRVDSPDPVSMGSYVRDMLLRLCATILEGSRNNETAKEIVEWLGGFVAISCAAGALANWTNFKVSRKFCLIGWIFTTLTPVITSSFPETRAVNWSSVSEQIENVSSEVWEEVMYFVSQQNCDQVVAAAKSGFDWAPAACAWARALRWIVSRSILERCDWFDKYGKANRQAILNNTTQVCLEIQKYAEDGVKAKQECKERVRQVIPEIIDAFRITVGVQAGISNKLKLMGAVMGMAPALMQGGLMLKNMIPRQTTPAILTTLPFVFTTLIWAQYQIYYQVLGSMMFFVACFAMSFGPLVYYLYSKYYRVVQPMCDQQSVTLTFRIWWYAAICAIITPNALLIVYFIWVNDFERKRVSQKIQMTPVQWFSLVVGVLSSYAYSMQAGIDWFVDEIVHHHTLLHAPAVLAATVSQEEANVLQRLLQADLDLQSIEKATYVCGGLGDPARMIPPEEGSWNEKAQIYASSLAYKDFATLDAFAGHIKGDPSLPAMLARARKPWYRMLQSPPDGSFNGTEIVGARTREEGAPDHEQPPSTPAEDQELAADPEGLSAAPADGREWPSSAPAGEEE